ncbi:Cof-type HAD-IIB family hydrolase [Flavobacterium granuli]|uniref:Cof subfamily protein (Haloacid dehalogenase superfamily) n=1 Tax=Flavobacterium granuli TaxID=280093 RepID=A0ABU1S3H2_9FLAO|nr:Cof-type HAD-IIB family hydrolase [Flavobacterium granuli]MDR6845548.1 Cof subfamily protein (haloacid dehalogenase superfamily) [Flavobacterium granuli]
MKKKQKMSKQKIKVVISDLDGTLLNSDHTISAYTKSVFRELHEQNYLIIVATGRHHMDAMAIVSSLELPIYLVTSNGARIHSPKKELLYSFNLEGDAVKSILSLDIDPEITTVLFKETVWQTSKTNKKLNAFQKDLAYPPEVVDFAALDDYSAIKIFFTHDDHQKLVDLRDKILEDHSDVFSHAFSLPICLEFMDKSVDKSVAIAKILEKEGYSFEEAISFGDGFNDEKMLDATGIGLIMGNAPENLKSKLPHLEVISTNNEDGVAKYLTEILEGLSVSSK